jgi:hypothetical protein
MTIIKTTLNSSIALVFSTMAAQADEGNGLSLFTSLSTGTTNYQITVPTALFANPSEAEFLPSHIGFRLEKSACIRGGVGYRLGGGSTQTGGFSWTISTAATASLGDTTLYTYMAPVKDHIINAARDRINSTIHDSIPPELYALAAEFGYGDQDVSDFMSGLSNDVSDYILDPSRPTPTNDEIILAFGIIAEPGTHQQALENILQFADTVRHIRSTVGIINDFPNTPSDDGTMLSFGIEGEIEVAYHFNRNTNLFMGVNAALVANASLNSNPFADHTGSSTVLIPFYGYEGNARIGVGFDDVANDIDLSASINFPFSQFSTSFDGVTISTNNAPYISLSATRGDGASITANYAHETNDFGLKLQLDF